MFGDKNTTTNEWTKNIFSVIWVKYNKPIKHYTLITGEDIVNMIFIENLNTMLDDNKILTLINSDYFQMIENTKLRFELENLNNASLITVSGCVIVYVSDTDLG